VGKQGKTALRIDVFEGGFSKAWTISEFSDRSQRVFGGGILEQVDGNSWDGTVTA